MAEYLPILIAGAIIGLFALIFLGSYLIFKNKLNEVTYDRNMTDREIMARLGKYAKPYWKQFIVVFVVLLLSIGYDLLSPMIIGEIEDTVRLDFELSYLYMLVAVYAGILLVSVGCTYIQTMILQKIGQKILSALRMDIFNHIEQLSHDQHNNIPVGKLVTRVTNDTDAISFMFTKILVAMVKNSMVLFGVLGGMLVMNYALTLMVLAFIPFLVLFTFVFRKFSRKAHRTVSDARTDVNTFLSENLSGMKITQIFNREDQKMEDFIKKSDVLAKAKDRQSFVFSVFRPMIYMLQISSVLFLLYLGARGHIKETTVFGQVMTSKTIVAFYMYIFKFYNPVQTLSEHFDNLQKAFASAEKIFSIMDMEPEVVDEPDAIELEHIRGEIEFRDVWFSYTPGEWVLQGVSFRVEPGQTVAFVGATGAGKTTILSLICRNYDIQKGQILIDGIDIRRIKLGCLRRHFGQMLQDVFLFSGTIRSNIVLREEKYTDEEIWNACRYVNADSFISKMDSGLDYEVRERGNNFSAGQRQLLSFARTILHKPSVMILDEATANIDTETEVLIQDSLEKMKSIGTMLIVAHRLSTVQHADNIILLSHGKIVEQGCHQELLRLKGNYYNLYTLQYTKNQLELK